MKRHYLILLALFFVLFSLSCKKKSTEPALGGDLSPMGQTGTTVSSSSVPISGVSGLTATIVSLQDGVSTYSGSAVVTNVTIKNILANLPGITITGDNVTATGFKFKSTTEGVESFVPASSGIIVDYNSNVGDTYPIGSTGNNRTVVSKSTANEYPYGLYLIKVMKVEEPTTSLKSMGVTKITYVANHRFGLVGVEFTFTDGTSAAFPVYTSNENP